MKKITLFVLLFTISGITRIIYGMATEQIGPDSVNRHPTVAQPDWPSGIVGIPRHESRVYSIWVNGNENFYFKCKVDEINELLAIFAKARMRDHVVRIESGVKKAITFAKEEIEYNVQLQIVAGIVLSFAREKFRDDLPLEPRLTILTCDDDSVVSQLKWPTNIIVENEIPGVSININNKQPKRDVYYGLCEFADGSPPEEFVKGVNSRITLWEREEPNGIRVGRIDNKGYCQLLLSESELAELKKGETWLTMSIGNFLTKAQKNDMRFPVEMLTKDKDKAKPVKVHSPSYYYGRILFEDGSPPVLDPPPWSGAEVRVDIRYGGFSEIDSEGYFKVPLTKEHFAKLSAEKPQRNVYVPDLVRKDRSKAEFTFPANLLSQNKAKAGVLKIPRPKLPRKELSDAESKIGKSAPGFGSIRFEARQEDKAKDKPLLICFWDMDQRPSRQCLRELEKQRQELQNKNTIVLAVYTGTKQEQEVRQWLVKEKFSLTVGMIEGDPYETLFAWGARGTPWLVLTDEEHIIIKEGFNLGDLSPLN